MKKMLLAAMLITGCAAAYAQSPKKDTASADTLLPYQKFPTLPAFNILELDSSTIFNTYNIPDGKVTLLMLFAPDCKHCRRTIKAMIKGMDTLKNAQLYLVTPVHSMTEIRAFYKEHHLADYKNVKLVGRDYEFFFHDFYGTKVVPDIALYDAHRRLIKLYEGEVTLADMYQYLQH